MNNNYKNKKVLIMGLGVHGGGVAAARFFAGKGAKVTITDLKPEEELKDSIKILKEFKDIKYVLGQHREEDFMNTDLVIRNPGVPKESKYLKIAIDNNVEVQMQEGIFFQLCPSKNIIGVTGTKGKTTVSYLIFEVLKANGLSVHLGGNMKIPLLDALEKIKTDDWVVLELSSWQCEALDDNHISPKISLITNISPDHLNRYASYKDYAMSKPSIIKYPTNEVFLTIKNCEFTDDFKKAAKGDIYILDPENGKVVFNGKEKYTINRGGFSKSVLQGEHNITNMMMACAVGMIMGLDRERSIQALIKFIGVPYRQQNIGKINDIVFINDTAATAPAGALEAMKTYKEKNPVFILGGADKGLDYSVLVKFVLENDIDYVLLKGTATDKMVASGLNGKVIFDNFKEAVNEAYKIASKKNGCVVLSPGCASFGMFKHEFDRGDQFNETFHKLKEKYETQNK